MMILSKESRKTRRRGLRRKGFTLLELLAVLVILAVLSIIAIPIFINKSNEAKQVAHNENMRTLQNQAQMYMLSHESVADQDDIIDAMVAEGLIKERPEYPINSLSTYAVQVVAGIPIVKLNGPVAPTLVITASTPNMTNATSITYTFTFSVLVTGFEDADIIVENGAPEALEGSGAVYTMVVTNTGVGQTQSISVPEGAAISTLGVASIGESIDIVLANTGETIVVGDYIQFGKYLTKPIIWRVIGKEDINSDGTQELMLFSDRIICLKSFDAADDAEVDEGRKTYGNNNWDKSNLREWLNSTLATVEYSTQKPDSLHVASNLNSYDTEAGFLSDSNFTQVQRDKIISVTHKSMLASVDDSIKTIGSSSTNHTYNQTNPITAVENYDTARYKDTSTPDSIFILNIKELNEYVYSNNSLSDKTTYYKSYVTTDVIENDTAGPVNDTTTWYYWLRDAYADYSRHVRKVSQDGLVFNDVAYNGIQGVRPALYLSSSNIILGTENGTTAATAYTITNIN